MLKVQKKSKTVKATHNYQDSKLFNDSFEKIHSIWKKNIR
jgi:hypothetical protein